MVIIGIFKLKLPYLFSSPTLFTSPPDHLATHQIINFTTTTTLHGKCFRRTMKHCYGNFMNKYHTSVVIKSPKWQHPRVRTTTYPGNSVDNTKEICVVRYPVRPPIFNFLLYHVIRIVVFSYRWTLRPAF